MNAITPKASGPEIMETVIAKGDLSNLTIDERNRYYSETCQSLGLNPLTRPFEYITLNNQLRLYCRRDACDQLRRIHNVSIEIIKQELQGNLYCVTAKATLPSGRVDTDMGVVVMPSGGALEIQSNTMMKAVTKAKRRVTLSIIGLGWLTEDEIEDAQKAERKGRKIRTVTSADKPNEISSSERQPLPELEEPAAASTPQARAAAGLSATEQQIDEMLDRAARLGGSKALEATWKETHGGKYPKLKKRLEEIHKPLADDYDNKTK
jgi:hypothetical protein